MEPAMGSDAYTLQDTHTCRDTYVDDHATSQRLSVTRIYDSDNHMNYVAIAATKKIHINLLYHLLLEFKSRHPLCLPEIIIPSNVGDRGTLIPATCFEEKSLAQLDRTWFFETVSLYDKTTRSYKEKSLYFTIQFKCALYSMIKQVMLSVKDNVDLQGIRPVIDWKQMFVTPVNGVIFTKYHNKVVTGNVFDFEIGNLVQLLDDIFKVHGDNSNTLSAEIEDLKQFLTKAKDSDAVLENILTQMVFWNRHMRIDYIYKLVEHVFCNNMSNGYAIYNKSKLAFLSADKKHTEWVMTFRNCGNPILNDVFAKGNTYIDMSEMPSKYRTYDMTGKDAYSKFLCGLTRFRDVFMHIDDYHIHDEHKRIVRNLHMQAVFQDIFPQHMVELKKSLVHVSGFNVKDRVMSLLGNSQDEARTS